MAWETDVRKGTARIGTTTREGFILMRDRDKRVVAFHATDSDERRSFLPLHEEDQFVVPEEAFEPSP
jgi:hypothetical protein